MAIDAPSAAPELPRASKLEDEAAASRTLRARVLSGSVILLFSSGFVGAMNLLYNLGVAHWLGADSFGHASAVYTVLMLLSSVTLSFQLLCSKFVAKNDSLKEKVGIYRYFHRRSWMFAISISILLAYSSPVVSRYLNLPTRNYIYMLAVATLFYIPLGVRRGLMQGMYDFGPLAFNFALEVVVKLGGAMLLMAAGYGVTGVIAAIVASVVVAYVFARPHRTLISDGQTSLPTAWGEGIQASVFFIGQVIINNLDIALVKHFFSATDAGVYATLALVGRVVYMLSWSVVSGMFPFSARAQSGEREGQAVLGTALLLVILISSLFTFGIWVAPQSLWHMLLGAGFPLAGTPSYTSLLMLYALTTGIYSLSVVLMSYEIARKIGNVSWLQLGFSGAIILGIYLFHNTLHEVIAVQTVLMLVLLVLVAVPYIRMQLAHSRAAVEAPAALGRLTKVKRVGEEEVIAEFLKSEFFQPEFNNYREPFRELVNHPDLSNEKDNKLRRALLFRRRGRMWRELPPDTEWWEVELLNEDLNRIRVFPRNQWRKHADESYYLLDTARRIRTRIVSRSSNDFINKLRSLSRELAEQRQPAPRSSVLLIGVDESGPLTIIEGNHRMTAATLVAPQEAHRRFRFLCGFSPRMTECCWYQTDLSSLWHYAVNSFLYIFEDRHGVINEALKDQMQNQPGGIRGSI
ncbi:MAG: lipopolysaccharide biosynthesis protein [Acidobacteriaceae bacterium]